MTLRQGRAGGRSQRGKSERLVRGKVFQSCGSALRVEENHGLISQDGENVGLLKCCIAPTAKGRYRATRENAPRPATLPQFIVDQTVEGEILG